MSQMFYGCSSLQTLNLSNFNTSLVTDMQQMFYSCSSLLTLNLSNFNTLLSTNMIQMFSECTSLKYLIISNFNFNKNSEGSIGGIFNNLTSLEYIDIYNI